MSLPRPAHAHQLAVECQITAIELAHQMLDRAEKSADWAMANHSRAMARKTYDSIVGLLTHLHPMILKLVKLTSAQRWLRHASRRRRRSHPV